MPELYGRDSCLCIRPVCAIPVIVLDVVRDAAIERAKTRAHHGDDPLPMLPSAESPTLQIEAFYVERGPEDRGMRAIRP